MYAASRATTRIHFVSFLLAYALIVSLCAPLALKRAQASAETNKGGKEKASTVGSSNREVSLNSGPQLSEQRPGEVLVRFREGVSEQEKATAAAAHGGLRKGQLRGESGIEKLEVVAGQEVETLVLQLRLNPAVEFAEPNFLIRRDDLSLDAGARNSARPFTGPNHGPNQPGALDSFNPIWPGSMGALNSKQQSSYSNSLSSNSPLQSQGSQPDDPRFSEQWALKNTGQNGGQFGSDIGVTAAWQTTTGSQSTVIAVIDSGIDFAHPELANNRWTNPAPSPNGDIHGWDYITDTGVVIDEQGHGTAIAGIIAAQGNNASGISGVMWRASLMSLRVLDGTGTGDTANAVEAIDYAVAHGAHVINISWGTSGESVALKEAIERALRRGVVVVCSAGNNGQDLEQTPYYPASFNIRDLIAVASSDNADQLASWSNWGRRRVSVAAPGVNILTTQMGGGYWLATGSSASAPLVSGVAGLIKLTRPWVSARDVAKAISDGARQVASLSGKVSSGGVVSASGALENLRGSPHPYPFPRPRYGSGGTGPGGSFNTTPPPQTTGAPGPNLPNLDQLRNAEPQAPRAREPIQSNLMCADCDPQSGGGGGSYYPPNDPNFSTSRERPPNETGQPGVDLGSRNFNWSLPLVSLAGRAGLDLNLTLFYNSLVWTKDGSYIKYNADLGSPAPGFRLGLPTLQQQFYNSQTGIWAYMMVTSSGGRVELRQVGSSSIYEAQDGSYTQLDVSNPSPVVKTSDGTQLKFTPVTINNEFRCVEIKDRNGNYISATYNTNNGHLQTIVDTLGRSVSFVYDGTNNLQAISQTWAGVTHNWATFNYGEVLVAPNFGGGLLVNGPSNSNVTVLTRVNLHDSSFYTFEYNTAFGQVKKINHFAPDANLLAYTLYNVDESAGQTDCPRFTERRDWGLYGVMNASQEVVTSYSVAGDGSWSQQTAPDGTIHKEFFYTTTWQSGLTYQTEVRSNGILQKWTTISWTQDDTSLSYQKNPRPIETNTYDAAGNRRRTTIEYNQGYSLPTHVREYGGADGQTYLRFSGVSYKMDAVYINRGIIGLPYERLVYDGPSGEIMSRTIFHYDWGAPYFSPQAPSTNYDSVNYPSSFVVGRGNLVAVRRYNCQNLTTAYDENQGMWVQLNGYNMAGSNVWTEDASGHRSTISYADSFSDGNNSRNTLAYPTTVTVTDPDNFSSTLQYNFDFGAVMRTQDPKGAVQAMLYDEAGRILRVTNQISNAYTRWDYPANMGSVLRYETIKAGAGETFSGDFLDGWGKVRATQVDNPGSIGGYKAVHVMYDAMGRLVWRSNPTEINGSWAPTGDDAAWVWTTQTYDWQGRPLLTTNPDGSTRQNIYGGCGCAGGETTTLRDERGRKRIMTMDTLGRLKKLEELNWNDSVYATTDYTYNARDQITNINQAGLPRTFVYDGHGRLQNRITPEQGTTTYSYNQDDTINVVTDARGATTTFGYNNRHLVTSLTYGVPGGVAATPNVSFGYDEAGNRTSMNDGLGSATYVYNTLSQMTSETRTFNGVGYNLSYSYNLAGQLTNITNPWGVQVGYEYDKTGRPTSVTGAGYAGVTSYINSISYRAFAAKQVSYANGRTLSLQYDNRMRMTRWDVPGVMGWSYAYNYFGENSGRLTYAQNLYDGTLDRSYEYDQVGRHVIAHSGAEARAAAYSGQWGTMDGPFSLGFDHDVWGNLTHRYGWGGEVQGGGAGQTSNIYYSYTNNRRNGFTYDAAGNLTNDLGQNFTYDATGQQAQASYGGYLLQQNYDGDRLRVKKVENEVTTYYLRSSVLGGQVVAEIDQWGGWHRGYVYLGGQMVGIQFNSSVTWVHQDPVNKSQRLTDGGGNVTSTIELDPWGADTNRSSNAAFQPRKFTSYERDGNGSDEAMFRRYNRWHSRFDQPDPYDGSYSLADPQSFNRYAYVQNDPVNFVDPTGLDFCWGETLISDPWNVTPLAGMEAWRCSSTRSGGSGGGGGGDGRGGGIGGGGVGSQNPTPVDVSKLGPPPPTCDEKLAAIFGGPGSVVSTVNEPPGIHPDIAGDNRIHHLANQGTLHIYGNAAATATDTGLYRPPGGTLLGRSGEYAERAGRYITGYSNVFRFGYSGGLVIEFFHVGGTSGGRAGGARLGRYPGQTNAAGSLRIGSIGGLGGEGDRNNHSHLQFRVNGKLTDPRKIYCGY